MITWYCLARGDQGIVRELGGGRQGGGGGQQTEEKLKDVERTSIRYPPEGTGELRGWA